MKFFSHGICGLVFTNVATKSLFLSANQQKNIFDECVLGGVKKFYVGAKLGLFGVGGFTIVNICHVVVSVNKSRLKRNVNNFFGDWCKKWSLNL